MSNDNQFVSMTEEELDEACGGRRINQVNVVQAAGFGFGGYGVGAPAMPYSPYGGGYAPQPYSPYGGGMPYSPYGGGAAGYGYGFPGYGMRLGTAL